MLYVTKTVSFHKGNRRSRRKIKEVACLGLRNKKTAGKVAFVCILQR